MAPAPEHRRRPKPRVQPVVRVWLGWFVALNVLWLALISAFDAAETALGLFAAALGATATTAVRQTGLVSFRPRARWLAPVWRLPGRTIVETLVVFGALWRRLVRGTPIRGRFRTEPFPTGGDADRAATRKALRTLGESVAPNTYVVGVDPDDETVLVHELVAPRERKR